MRSDTETRAFRCDDGTYTTIKLEARWWTYLDKIAERENESHIELLKLIFNGAKPFNRAAFIRLWIVDYLMKLAKTIIKKSDVEIPNAHHGMKIFLSEL